MGICPLASGSRGNSIFLKSKIAKILIDDGISYNDLQYRLNCIGVKLKEIDAILITHDHKDHIEGLKMLLQKIDIPIFVNLETAREVYKYLEKLPKFQIFSTNEEFEFKDISIYPFSVPHDALDPVGFKIKIGDYKIGFCTDLGFVTSLVRNSLKDCDFLYLESNHDKNMVLSSKRPDYLKKRILGKLGHLSNEECEKLIAGILHPKLKHICLAHISSECNNRDLAFTAIKNLLIKNNHPAKLSIAYQKKISDFIDF